MTEHDTIPRPSGHPRGRPREERTLVRELQVPIPPREALARLRGMPGRVLLESVRPGERFSFLAAAPVLILRAGVGGRVELRGGEGGEGSLVEVFSDPFEGLEALLRRVSDGDADPPALHPFAGGVVGFLGYEAGDVLEELPPPPPDDLGLPDAWFGVYDAALVWDHQAGVGRAVGTVLPGVEPDATRSRLDALLARVVGGAATDRPSAPSPGLSGPHRSSLSREAFEAAVGTIRERILSGDLFQANLTRRLSVPIGLDAEALYARMVSESPPSHGAYLDMGEAEVVSISPELFLSVRGREVRTAPIKGTRPRGGDVREDERRRSELEESAKDRAENVMIVDLLRNDLSRVCLPGTVRVPRLAEVISHPTVHHLVSVVEGRLAPGCGVVDLLRATFPGGSITGAPKIQAMRLLRELEPVRRGVYTGALGILGFGGDVELSVAIRTAVVREGWAHYGTGGGITLGSDPAEEWLETRDKAAAFLRALA